MNRNAKVKICVIASAGGHLTQALRIAQGINKNYNFYYVTYYLPHIRQLLKGLKHYLILNPHKNLFKYLVNFFQSLKIYMKERPNFIITTGSGMAVPTCLIGKFFGSKLIYIESGSRVKSPSLTGRFLYYFSDIFIVQWRSILRYFKKAVYGGSLI